MHEIGYGSYDINVYPSTDDTLTLLGTNYADWTLSSSAAFGWELVLVHNVSGETITVDEQLRDDARYGVATITWDNQTLTKAQLIALGL